MRKYDVRSVLGLLGLEVRWSLKVECVAFALAAVAHHAHAASQTSPGAVGPPQEVEQPPNALQEVVVTAEKRQSTVQATPMSLTAITGADLQGAGISSVAAIATEAPGISMRSAGPGQTEYEMRGLSSLGGAAPTVGFYLDETPLTAPAAALNGKVTIDPDLFDLSRVEILRGPQGTLYGASSMGGTIKLVTNKPNLTEFQGAAETLLSDTDGGGFNYGGNAMLNLPIASGTAAVRLVGTYKYNDGFIDYKVVNPFPIGPGGSCGFGTCVRGDVAAAPVVDDRLRANWERQESGRISGRLEPTDSLDVNLMIMHQSIDMGGWNQVDIPPGPGVALAHYQPFPVAEPFSDRFNLYSATINDSFDFAQLTSATAYWSRDSAFTGDNSEVFQSLWSAFFGVPQLLPIGYTENDHSKQFSQELRLVSSGDGRFQWIGGGFFSNFSSTFGEYVANPAYAADSTGGAEANPLGVEYQANNPYHVKQYALFGEGSYKIASAWKATVGLRWYNYDTRMNFEQSGVYTQTGNATPFTGQVSASDRGFNPKINLAYLPTGDLTAYGTIAKGFRPGGVNLPVPTSICQEQVPLAYGPDGLWNYEVGEKARLLGGLLTVNADVYYIRWKNIQQYLTLGCGFQYSLNAGTAESYGPEVEITAKVAPGLELSANGAYTRARIVSVNPQAQGQTEGPSQPLVPGLAILNVPEYTGTFAATYSWPLSGTLSLSARAEDVLVGPQYDINYYYTRLPAYSLVNLRFGLLGDKFSAYLFASNVTDRHALLTIDNSGYTIAVPSLTRATINQPRTVGLDLQVRF
jgi:outer membrane receptor protein involved in Fe transport